MFILAIGYHDSAAKSNEIPIWAATIRNINYENDW